MPLSRAASTRLTVLVALIAVWGIDYLAGRDWDLWILYVIPVVIAAVALGLRAGLAVSLCAGAMLLINGSLLGNPYMSLPPFLLDRLSEFVGLSLIAALAASARGQLSRLM